MKIKKRIAFSKKGNIENTIYRWAKRSRFYEYTSEQAESLVDIDNVTYCFYRDDNNERTFLTVHQLDSTVYIEVWIARGIHKKNQMMSSINELLMMLGQEPSL